MDVENNSIFGAGKSKSALYRITSRITFSLLLCCYSGIILKALLYCLFVILFQQLLADVPTKSRQYHNRVMLIQALNVYYTIELLQGCKF